MWKDIKHWENLYEVNERGEVRNKLTNHLLIGDKNSEGYARVCLYNKKHDPQKQRFFRHRLVAETFIPNPDNLLEVNHIDTNIEHNDVANLEWCTKEYNELHSRKYGSKEYKPFEVIYNNNTTKQYNVARELSDELNVSRHTIQSWLHKISLGYRKHNIKSIEYV